MEKIDLKIPSLGEAEDTEIIEVNIKSGDKVSIDDPLIVLESEKAAMEIPSDYTGIITEVYVKEGDKVKEGIKFARIEAAIDKNTPKNNLDEPEKLEVSQPKREESVKGFSFGGINAGPAVRKYARELEIDLRLIEPTGRNNQITKYDLKNFIHSKVSSRSSYLEFNEDQLKQYGDYTIEKQSRIRSLGSENLHSSWISIPHVTHFDEIDLSCILQKQSTIKASILSFITFYLCETLREFPIFNSSLLSEGNIMLKKYFNIGIAVDTEQGLVVPVIKNADQISIEEIDTTISELAKKSREKKLRQDDLEGGTFTVSSLGKFGGIGFTPIINPPEVGILAVSNFQKKLAIENEKIVEKTFVPVSLSYDHRVINGADAGRFMLALKDKLESCT